MPPKNPIVDTDEIAKRIWQNLYIIIEKKWLTQTEIAEKLWVKNSSISFWITGKKTTGNLDQYWKIA